MANNPLVTTISTDLTKNVASVSGTPVAGYDDTAGQVKISKNAVSVGSISSSASTPVTVTSGALSQAASPTPANIGGTGVSSLSGEGLVQYSSGIVTTAPATGSWLQYVSSASAWQAIAYPSTSAPVIANKQEFTSGGTWTKPSGINFVRVICMGGGGGGGAGTKGASTAEYVSGGNGGGGGGCSDMIFPASLITGSTVSVVVGSGGSGGVYLTSTAATDGGNTSFGTVGDPWFVMATGGKAGAVGEVMPLLYADGTYAQLVFPLTAKGGIGTLPGGAGGSLPVHGNNYYDSLTSTTFYNHSAPGGGGGGAGTGFQTTTGFKGQGGGAGGAFQGNTAVPGGNAGAGATPTNGSAGGSSLAVFGISTAGMIPTVSYFGSGGGGGSGSKTTAGTTAGTGGAGGNGGGGGGGGGASYANASNAAGNGGAGGAGWCLILCW